MFFLFSSLDFITYAIQYRIAINPGQEKTLAIHRRKYLDSFSLYVLFQSKYFCDARFFKIHGNVINHIFLWLAYWARIAQNM